MIAKFRAVSNWLAKIVARDGAPQSNQSPAPADKRPSLRQMADPAFALPPFVQQCPLAGRYLALLGQLDWDNFSSRDPDRVYPGSQPEPRPPFVVAFLIKLDQKLRYMADLRHFLAAHPALIWLCGFPLHPSIQHPYGFDPGASLPTTRQFLHVLRTLPNEALQFLLTDSLSLIRAELPAELQFGRHISGDTKHILAWVKENNPKAYLKRSERYDKNRQPKADRDCKLGCKKRSNQIITPAAEGRPAHTVSVGQYYWGYASGIIATKVPGYGEVVLAELTQTFDKGDTTFFFPLMAETEARLGFKPPYGAFDAAFDAWYTFVRRLTTA